MNTEFPTYFSSKHALSMELRDYFAAKALQGYVTAMRPNPTAKDAICNGDYTENNAEAISKASYILADAMMEARKENK